MGHEVSRTGGTEAAAPGTFPTARYGSQTAPPREIGSGFSHRCPMLILIALICAAYLITAQAAGIPTLARP